MPPLHQVNLTLEWREQYGEVRVEYLPRSDGVVPTICYVWWQGYIAGKPTETDITDEMTFEEINQLARRIP